MLNIVHGYGPKVGDAKKLHRALARNANRNENGKKEGYSRFDQY